MRPTGLVLLAVWVLASVSAHALTVPFDIEHASVLPSGVSSPRVKWILGSGTGKFGDVGQRQDIASPLRRAVTVKNLLDAQGDPSQRASLKSLLLTSPQISDSDIVGHTTAGVSSYTSAIVPVLMVGITPKLTAGIAVPVVKTDIRATTGFVKTATGEAVTKRVIDSTSPVRGNEAINQLNDAINYRLKQLGYEPVQDRTLTAIGDARLIGRYQITDDGTDTLLAKTTIYFPTGKTASPDRVIDAYTGAGRYSMLAMLIYDRWSPLGIDSHLKFNVSAGAMLDVADSTDVRVPTMDSPFSADRERVSRGWGRTGLAGSSLSYQFTGIGTTLGVGYNFQAAAASSYSGTLYAPERYLQLERQNPYQILHSATIQLGLSTVSWYRQGIFPVPMDFSASYNRGFAGRNVNDLHVWSTEAIFYL